MTVVCEHGIGIGQFQATVYRNYHLQGRSFPWRETSDPYHILVSEIMLQQTQTERVIVKYGPFIATFPDFQTLLEAPIKNILIVWQGLGYNRRVLNLKSIAQKVVTEHKGRLPAIREELTALPGIGQATAGSILAFAFNIPIAFIETNIRRVFIHFFFADRDIVNDGEILPLVDATLDRRNPRQWYYALMDYGVMLKGASANLNRKSAHYQRQSPFEGSERQVRGRIIKALISCREASPMQLSATLHIDLARITSKLLELEREGLLERFGDGYRIP
jgi:A/G-specific adenine glycosylase